MHSVNTTLNKAFEIFETNEEKKEREKIKNPSQDVSARYIISRYAENKEGVVNRFNSIKGLKDFIAVYHTLGNFIPFPVDCNVPRGTGKTQDYWDLTLYYIYQYYIDDNDKWKLIFKNEKDVEVKKERFRKWLDSYKGTNGQDKWDNFIKGNYLQDFVDNNGLPKELWTGHFTSGNVEPNSKEEIEQFCCNAAAQIIARGERMIDKLKESI